MGAERWGERVEMLLEGDLSVVEFLARRTAADLFRASPAAPRRHADSAAHIAAPKDRYAQCGHGRLRPSSAWRDKRPPAPPPRSSARHWRRRRPPASPPVRSQALRTRPIESRA